MRNTTDISVQYADGLVFRCDKFPAKGFPAFDVLVIESGCTTIRLFLQEEDARSTFAAAASKFLFPARED